MPEINKIYVPKLGIERKYMFLIVDIIIQNDKTIANFKSYSFEDNETTDFVFPIKLFFNYFVEV